MNERIEALPEDKRRSILSASLAEFAEYGYTGASTNRIVKAAGISKGLLFHYFGSKKGLFLFVLDHTIKYLLGKVNEYAAALSGDFFERMGQYAMIKTRLGIEEPEMYRMLYDVFLNLPSDIKDELMEHYGAILSDQRKAFVSIIDKEKLREGVTPEAAVNLIVDFLDGYYKRNIDYYKTMTPEELLKYIEEMRKDLMGYLEIIKKGIYKDGE